MSASAILSGRGWRFGKRSARAPGHPPALAQLAVGLKGKLPPEDQAEIERLLAEPGMPADERWQLELGLAQALDGKGEFDRAAALSIEAHALFLGELKRQGRVYDPGAHHAVVSKMIATFTAGHFARVRGFGADSERPVFVIGMHRSGTSLVEQVLASHPRVFGAGELPLARNALELLPVLTRRSGHPLDCVEHLDREGARRLANRYLEILADFNASADRIVDKLPDNTVQLGLIATIFPRAKIIHCRRDLRDVALSCWMTNLSEMPWACAADHIAGRIHEYQRLMEHWRRVLPIDMFELDYETLVNDFEPTARELLAWCGLDWDPACLEFHQARRPSGRPARPRFGSRYTGARWGGGSITRSHWRRCLPSST